MRALGLIVEGHGEMEAAPVLARRIAYQLGVYEIFIPKPVRVRRQRVEEDFPDLERACRLLDGRVDHTIVLIDSDGECPAELANRIRSRLATLGLCAGVSVVAAVNAFESWFLASSEAIRGERGLRSDVPVYEKSDDVPAPKRRLRDHLEPGRAYRETVDQPAFAALIDLDVAPGRSPSLDKFIREVMSAVAVGTE